LNLKDFLKKTKDGKIYIKFEELNNIIEFLNIYQDTIYLFLNHEIKFNIEELLEFDRKFIKQKQILSQIYILLKFC